jgi:hypothetical protein
MSAEDSKSLPKMPLTLARLLNRDISELSERFGESKFVYHVFDPESGEARPVEKEGAESGAEGPEEAPAASEEPHAFEPAEPAEPAFVERTRSEPEPEVPSFVAPTAPEPPPPLPVAPPPPPPPPPAAPVRHAAETRVAPILLTPEKEEPAVARVPSPEEAPEPRAFEHRGWPTRVAPSPTPTPAPVSPPASAASQEKIAEVKAPKPKEKSSSAGSVLASLLHPETDEVVAAPYVEATGAVLGLLFERHKPR